MNQEEIMENTEVLEVENTEIIEKNNVEVYTEVPVGYEQSLELLTNIYNDVHIIMVFTIITFMTACLRGWRKNVIKGVR